MSSGLRVKKSGISGQGVYADKNFNTGDAICMFAGKKTSVAELEQIYKAGKNKISCDAFQTGVREYLIIDEPWILINHSCDPNTAFKGNRSMVAIKPIRKGEEIFYDYSATEWTPRDYTEYNHSMWPLRCRCKSARCRHLIVCFPYLPKRIQNKYLEHGIIQSHILKQQKLLREKRRCDVCEEAIERFKTAS